MDYKLEQFKKRKNAKKLKETKKQQQVALCSIIYCTQSTALHDISEALLYSSQLCQLRLLYVYGICKPACMCL
jgi:hypothetical protein